MIFSNGQEVRFQNSIWTITAISRGWLTVMDESGNKAKAREKDLSSIPVREMRAQLAQARERYTKTTSYGGETSYDNGDEVAELLRGLEPQEVCAVADTALGADAGYHQSRYGHLNPGQQRMNAGNRIRAALKSAKITLDAIQESLAGLSPEGTA